MSKNWICKLNHHQLLDFELIFLGKSGIFQNSNFVDGTLRGSGEVNVISKHQEIVSNIASTSTYIDDRLSPGNVTILSGETAMLACKIYNLGNKSVRLLNKEWD